MGGPFSKHGRKEKCMYGLGGVGGVPEIKEFIWNTLAYTGGNH